MRRRLQTGNLRQQVAVERRRRNILFFTIVILAFSYISVALVFGDMGFLKYRTLTRTKNKLETEIGAVEKENAALKTHITALKEDNFYIEKYAREEYGLAKPDEYIFQFKDDDR